jgi:hypothetical protein
MRLNSLFIVGSLVVAATTSAFAQSPSQGPDPMLRNGRDVSSGMVRGDRLRERETGMPTGSGQPGGERATTPGTNSHAGAGRGTTGTGQQGGSGNE